MNRKRNFGCFLFMFAMLVFVLLPNSNHAQSIKRQCISSYGASGIASNAMVMQTAGQSFSTKSASSDEKVLQGFQQSTSFNLQVMPHNENMGLELNVYPNPATKLVCIKSKEPMEDYYLNVTDNNGRLIVSHTINGYKQFNLVCDTWNDGVYFIRVNDSQGNNETLKLLIAN